MQRSIVAKAHGCSALLECWPDLELFSCVSCQTRPLDVEPRRYAC